MKWLAAFSALAVTTMVFAPWQYAQACSRILYETGNGTHITRRSMDRNDPTVKTALWVFPRGMERDGGIGTNSVKWTSQYGSVIASFYDAGVADGMNEKGLVGNLLYLADSDYGDPAKTSKPTISIGAWLQYFLDNYATVKVAVEAMADPPFTVVAPVLPNGRAAGHGRSEPPKHLHDAVAHRGGPGSESLLLRIGHHARGVLSRPEQVRFQEGLGSEENPD